VAINAHLWGAIGGIVAILMLKIMVTGSQSRNRN